MVRKTGWMLVAGFGLFLARPADAQVVEAKPAERIVVDAALAKTGKGLFSAKVCSACHSIGKGSVVGPDLNGVFERRSLAWLKRWLKDPTPMLETDEQAKAMLKEYNDIKMPNLNLKDDEILALLHYLASEQKDKK